MLLRELKESERELALELAWSVFMEYEAPDYSKQGIDEFYRSIHDLHYLNMLRIYGAFIAGEIVGVIATRSSGNHVALFFVDGKHHGQGIGRKLFELVVKDNSTGRITVNSSPFAVSVYHQLGFRATDEEQVTNGLRYTPMEFKFQKEKER